MTDIVCVRIRLGVCDCMRVSVSAVCECMYVCVATLSGVSGARVPTLSYCTALIYTCTVACSRVCTALSRYVIGMPYTPFKSRQLRLCM